MKTDTRNLMARSSALRAERAFTLLEMTVVIMVLLALVGIGFVATSQLDQWKLGRSGSEALRTVYAAQRMFLADNPTTLPANITEVDVINYLPNVRRAVGVNPTSLRLVLAPVISLTGSQLDFRVTTIPPTLIGGSGNTYDPSGSGTDSLWDVGETGMAR